MEISVSLSGAQHAWLVPLDVHSLRHALACMANYVLCDKALDMSTYAETSPSSLASPLALHVTLVRDTCSWSANVTYLQCPSPTNVLSFPLHTPCHSGELVPPVGDMLVAVDTLRREAFLYGQDVTVYAIALFAHGIAHLAGLVHGEAMTLFEQNLVASIR